MKFLQDLYQTTFSSNPFLFPLLFLLFPLLNALLINLKKRSKGLNLPPSPPRLPVIGNLHQIGSLPHHSFRSLSEKYGPLLLLHFGSIPTLVVSSADLVDEIFRKHDHAFASRPFLKAVSVLLYGGRDVILCPYGEYWRHAKKICVLHLLNQNMVRAFESIRQEEVASMLKGIHSSCLDGSEIDFREMLSTVTSNVIYRSATGYRSEDRVHNMTYKEWMVKFKKLLEEFCFEDLFPYLGWMDVLTGFSSRLKKTFEDIDDFLGQIIDDHTIRNVDDKSSGKNDFVDIILRLQGEGMLDIDLTRDDIKAIINGLFSAATDTVSIAMEWIMAEIVKHPRVMKKAQDEIRLVVGEKSEIRFTDVNQMHYLKCVIKEAMRLHAFGLVPRETTKAIVLSGYDIPPKTRVMINVWGINRDPKVWHNPDEFRPERFEGIQVDFVGHHKGFIPFGFGRRSCPGMSYALALVEVVVANLLCWYDWKLPGGIALEDLNMEEKFLLNINRKKPLCLVPISCFPTKQFLA